MWDWSVIFLITWDWGGVSECGEWGCERNVTNGDKNLERAVNPLRRANDVNEEFQAARGILNCTRYRQDKIKSFEIGEPSLSLSRVPD